MKVAVIGGGASGLVAAYAAAARGNHVTVFERNEKCGKKIYITGKGRCNVTNDCEPQEFLQKVVRGARFLSSAICSFPPRSLMALLESGGLRLKTERGNRVFPVSDKASDVTKCLQRLCEDVNVAFRFNEKVTSLSVLNSSICGISTEKELFECEKVIVCTGGLSYKSTGSDGDGYRFAKQSGHKTVECVPSLCGINLKGEYFKGMSGLSLKNVSLIVYGGGKKISELFGEMQFTHFGASGPLVLTASAQINRLPPSTVRLVLDLKPALSNEQLEVRLLRDFSENANKTIYNCLRALMPAALIGEVLKRSQIPEEKKVNSVTKTERSRLLTNIKNFDMLFLSLRGFEEAVVTSGGVDLKQVNPKTMESKLISGLYFCGEVLDVDAYTGGFNLQIAFSTGYAAGNSIG